MTLRGEYEEAPASAVLARLSGGGLMPVWRFSESSASSAGEGSHDSGRYGFGVSCAVSGGERE